MAATNNCDFTQGKGSLPFCGGPLQKNGADFTHTPGPKNLRDCAQSGNNEFCCDPNGKPMYRDSGAGDIKALNSQEAKTKATQLDGAATGGAVDGGPAQAKDRVIVIGTEMLVMCHDKDSGIRCNATPKMPADVTVKCGLKPMGWVVYVVLPVLIVGGVAAVFLMGGGAEEEEGDEEAAQDPEKKEGEEKKPEGAENE